jgi:molybdenum cofactor cytidylyltransferase
MGKLKVFILAAGSSSRLGYPKQLVRYRGKFLINHTLDILENTGFKDINVILGSNAYAISKEIQKADVNLIINKSWDEGMSSSIRSAIISTENDPIEGVLFLTCDQFMITKELLAEIKTKQCSFKDKIICCDYGNGFGPPSLFPNIYFDELNVLKGDAGGKSIIKKNFNNVIWIDFPGGDKDIDYEGDLDLLIK